MTKHPTTRRHAICLERAGGCGRRYELALTRRGSLRLRRIHVNRKGLCCICAGLLSGRLA